MTDLRSHLYVILLPIAIQCDIITLDWTSISQVKQHAIQCSHWIGKRPSFRQELNDWINVWLWTLMKLEMLCYAFLGLINLKP
jgi:hypothetical protein